MLSLWVILTVESVDEILNYGYGNPSSFRKATERVFRLGLFIMLYKVAPTFESVGEILKLTVTTMKAIEQCFPVMLFIILYLGDSNLTFESVRLINLKV